MLKFVEMAKGAVLVAGKSHFVAAKQGKRRIVGVKATPGFEGAVDRIGVWEFSDFGTLGGGFEIPDPIESKAAHGEGAGEDGLGGGGGL